MAYGIVYKIENTINGKIYIGITTSKKGFKGRYSAKGKGIERVYNFYKYQLKNNQFCNIHLMNSIEKYGLENFKVNECFDVAYSKKQLKEKEKEWVSFYESNNINKGYNRTEGGESFLKGKEHPRYNSVECICEVCGTKFLRERNKQERHKGTYCSQECSNKGFSLKFRGVKNPNYAKLTVNCYQCGKEITRSKSLINKTNFCDLKCQAEYYKNRYKGENNPNYGNKGAVSGSKNGRAKKTICITTGKEFDCLKDGAIEYNIKYSILIGCLNGKQKTAGTHPTTGERLKWKYKD